MSLYLGIRLVSIRLVTTSRSNVSNIVVIVYISLQRLVEHRVIVSIIGNLYLRVNEVAGRSYSNSAHLTRPPQSVARDQVGRS